MAIDVRIYHDPDNGQSFVNFGEGRVDYATNERTGERMPLPFAHQSSISLGDYAIRVGDDVLATADAAIAAGKMKEADRPVLPPDYARPIIGYRLDDFIAARQDFLVPLIGKDLSPIVAAASAKYEAAQAIAAQVAASADAIIADAQAQAAKIIADAQTAVADVQAEPVDVMPAPMPVSR